MAYAHDTVRSTEGLSIWQRAADLRAQLGQRFAQHRLYRATLNELSALTDRDLADMGLHRAMLADVAREASSKA